MTPEEQLLVNIFGVSDDAKVERQPIESLPVPDQWARHLEHNPTHTATLTDQRPPYSIYCNDCLWHDYGPPARPEKDGGCKGGDPTCPCQDGDQCHYEGDNPMVPRNKTGARPLTDEEWREFQQIPEEGHSHRAWVDWKIQERAAEVNAGWVAAIGQRADEAVTQRPDLAEWVIWLKQVIAADHAATVAAQDAQTGGA